MELLGKTREQLREYCLALGEPAYRAAQIYHALYAERKFDFAGMTNLPAALREKLAREATVTLPAVKQRYVSTDGSVRYLVSLDDGRNRRRLKQFTCRANGDRRFAFPRRRVALWIASFA